MLSRVPGIPEFDKCEKIEHPLTTGHTVEDILDYCCLPGTYLVPIILRKWPRKKNFRHTTMMLTFKSNLQGVIDEHATRHGWSRPLTWPARLQKSPFSRDLLALWTGTIGPKKLAGQHQDGVTMGLARVPQCQCTPWSEHGAWARRSRTGAAPEAGVHGGGKRR